MYIELLFVRLTYGEPFPNLRSKIAILFSLEKTILWFFLVGRELILVEVSTDFQCFQFSGVFMPPPLPAKWSSLKTWQIRTTSAFLFPYTRFLPCILFLCYPSPESCDPCLFFPLRDLCIGFSNHIPSPPGPSLPK